MQPFVEYLNIRLTFCWKAIQVTQLAYPKKGHPGQTSKDSLVSKHASYGIRNLHSY